MRDEAEQIFADALEADPAQRAAFIAQACGGDRGLQAEVEALLADAEAADTFFESLTRGAPGNPGADVLLSNDRNGVQIGPYRLIRLLGRGGFGSVWMAEQKEPIRRVVALKLIKRGMDSEEVLARFRAEQQALALMDHPHIARVFDAGSAPDGRPFFVMEWVDGEKITEYCDRRALPITERLRLFLQVCAAVNHAHQKGIIHRDLKPSNILVASAGGDPLAKVIDFGIAKAIDGSLTGGIDVTREDQFIGTPAYMSPEQAGSGRADIDTRTDVYSLGIVLYELLAGTPPFEHRSLLAAGREEIRRIIREEDPVRPSTKLLGLPEEELTSIAAARATSKGSLPRLLGSELDWIAMKAIEKSKERRYGNADALARDVMRFIAGEPVQARPPSTAYLLGKLARRHRVLLGTLVLIAAILLSATGISLWLAFRAREAERLADARLAQALEEKAGRERALGDAEAVSRFIVEIFQRPDPEKDGRKVTAVDVLAAAEKGIPEGLSGQPGRQILLKRTLAETYTGLGLYQEALRLRREILEGSSGLFGGEAAETLDDSARLADLLLRLGYYSEAFGLVEREVALRKARQPADSAKLAAAESTLVECLERTGQHERARELRGARPSGSATPSPTASEWRQGGEKGEALRKREVAATHERIAALSQSKPPGDPELLRTMGEAAYRLFRLAEMQSAIAMQRDLVGRLTEKYGPDHMFTIEGEDFLAFLVMKSGGDRESFVMRENLLERRRRIFGPEHFETLDAEARFAQVLFFGGRLADATILLERVVPALDKVAGPDHRATLNARSDLARCYMVAGRTPEAIVLLKESVPGMRDDSFIGILLAKALLWAGRNEEYQAHRNAVLQWAWDGRQRIGARPDLWERQMLLASLAPFESPEQADKVREILRLCAEQRVQYPEKNPRQLAWQKKIHGVVHYRLGDFATAKQLLEEAVELCASGAFNNTRNVAAVFLALARSATGDPSAPDFYREVRRKIPEPPSGEHPLNGIFDTEGDPLTAWIARREADAHFSR